MTESRIAEIIIDSFWDILIPGLTVTIPLTAISFAIAMVIGIVLPQAMRTAFPTLANSLIAMVKDTSLAANITVTEMFMVTRRIVARTYEPLILYIEVGLVYLLFCTVLTKLQSLGENRLNARGMARR